MSKPYDPDFTPNDFAETGPDQPTVHRPNAALQRIPTSAAQPMAAPGWYQEPGKPGVLRYWNGVSWEEWRKPLVEAPSITQGQKSMVVAYLLLLFLGGTGAHRLYLGRTGTGVTMLVIWLAGLFTSFFGIGLLLFAVVGIWSFIDLFLVPGLVRQSSLKAIQPRY